MLMGHAQGKHSLLASILVRIAAAIPITLNKRRYIFETGGARHIIQHQDGLIQVIRTSLNSGDALSFCSLTAGRAIAAG